MPKDSVTCSSDLTSFLTYFDDPLRTTNDTTDKWVDFEKGLCELDESPVEHNIKHDYTVVLTWATFAGRLNKNSTKEWGNEAINKQKEGCDLELVYVNRDIRDYWSDSILDKLNQKR